MSQTSIELVPITSVASGPVSFPRAKSPVIAQRHEAVVEGEPERQATLDSSRHDGDQHVEVTTWNTVATITTVSGVTSINGLTSDFVIVAVPAIAADIKLESSLLLWPASIYHLTCGCTLLLFGALADVVGSRSMYLIGTGLQSAFTLACGFARTGHQLFAFRALAGIAISVCLPSAVSIITNTFPAGSRRRNIGFSAMGGAQAVGFSIGLVLGGVFADGIGWRWGFYAAAIINTGMPHSIKKHQKPATWTRVLNDIDWVGALITSTSMALLSYVFNSITHATHEITVSANIALLTTAIALIPAFVFWVGRQERLGRPAIVPNSLWRNRIFTTICICVFLTWAQFQAIESVMTFFFQYVQHLSALQTSIRFLGAPIAGTATNIITGLVVHKVFANWAITLTTGVSAISNILLALNRPADTYWKFAAPGIFLNVIRADCLFTISNLIITSVYPEKTQALAGGVFNTIAQIGKSVGLATTAVLAASVTANSKFEDKTSSEALFEGYKAAYWYCCALSVTTLICSGWGLKKIGKVGKKED